MQLTRRLTDTLKRVLSRPNVFWYVPLVGAALTFTSVFTGYAGDDFFHRMVLQDFPGMPEIAAHPGISSIPWDTFTFAPGDKEGNKLYVERGLLPWWSPEDVLFRRLHFPTSVTHWLDMVIFGHRAWVEHLHNVLLYALVVAAASLVYRRLLSPVWLAALATLLYAIDDAHGMTVAWIMNRNALHGAIFGYLALAAHIRWRAEGWRWGLPLAWLSLALGVACSEGTLAIGAYLFAHMLCLDKKGSLPIRFARLLPYAVLVLIWRIAYDAMGFGIHGSGIYVDLGSDVGLFAKKLAINFPILLLSLFAAPNPAISIAMSDTALAIYVSVALAVLALLGIGLIPLFKRSAEARFFALGAVLSTIPFCATLPDHRLLLFSGLGSAGLVAMAVRYLGETVPASGQKVARITAIAIGILIVFNLLKAPLSLPIESIRFAQNFRVVTQSAATLPSDESVTSKTVVIVRAPSDWFLLSLPQILSAERAPMPKNLYTLCSVPDAVDVTRIDEYTLEVTPADSFLADPWATMFCRSDIPFERDEIMLDAMNIRIMERDAAGRPVRVRFRFDNKLDSPNLAFLTYTEQGFHAMLVPGPNETTHLGPMNFWTMSAEQTKAPTQLGQLTSAGSTP